MTQLIDMLNQIQSNEVTAVSTDFLYPKADYALKVEKVDVVTSESGFTRIVFHQLIEDVYNADASIDISKLVGKKMVNSIGLFSQDEAALKESLGRAKHAVLNSGGAKEHVGNFTEFLQTCVNQTTIHPIYQKVGKDGVTRNEIAWTEKKPKAE